MKERTEKKTDWREVAFDVFCAFIIIGCILFFISAVGRSFYAFDHWGQRIDFFSIHHWTVYVMFVAFLFLGVGLGGLYVEEKTND